MKKSRSIAGPSRILLTMVVVLGGAYVASGQVVRWPDPVANDVAPYASTRLTHGPLLGRLSSRGICVWARTREPSELEVVFDTRLPLTDQSPRTPLVTRAEDDMTGVAHLHGLTPNTRYYYAVSTPLGVADLRPNPSEPWPSFRTLPDERSHHDPLHNPRGWFNITFAIGHCASQDPDRSGGQYVSTPAFDSIRRRHAQEAMFGIVNGDVIYEERRDGTLDGVRENYRLYFSRGQSFSNLFRYLPGAFTFDDHDVGWDIHGCGQVGLGEGPHLIRDIGLRAYEDYLEWANPRGPQSGRIRLGRASVKAGSPLLVDETADFSRLDLATISTLHLGCYTRDEALRRRNAPRNAGVYGVRRIVDAHRLEIEPAPQFDEEIDYSIGVHHYYDWRVGNCHFFALDTRGERSNRNPRDRHDPKLFLLGPAQEKWLTDGVAASDADFIFLISPDPWTIYHTAAHVSDAPGADQDDKGDGFPSFLRQRERLLEFLDRQPKPVLIFTGDVHASASVKITDNVWEMMCGPLGSTGHPIATLGNPPRGGMWDSQGRRVEFRWVTGFPNNLPYERIRNTYYGIVQVNNVLPVARPAGPGYQWAAYDRPQVIVRWHDGYTGRLAYAESITAGDAK
ncbi:MAG: alkaline phosphatase D family protein [Planctomycetales bacterium]|nr:alkaline phosphatase D family protein [Planctomycetales bacterium]